MLKSKYDTYWEYGQTLCDKYEFKLLKLDTKPLMKAVLKSYMPAGYRAWVDGTRKSDGIWYCNGGTIPASIIADPTSKTDKCLSINDYYGSYSMASDNCDYTNSVVCEYVNKTLAGK